MKLRRILLCSLVCVLLLTVVLLGSVIAYMFRQTVLLTNELVPAQVSCLVTEAFDGDKKTEIRVQNTGTIDAYLRVRLVSYWANDDGEIVGKASKKPVFTVGSGWIAGSNDTYYYSTPVAPTALASDLLGTDIVLEISEEGYRQVVEVFAEAIQSKPDNAVQNSWHVTVANDKITGVS